VRAPADGVAVPESVGNELAVAPLDSRLIVPAPFVMVTVPPVLVKFAQTGDALVPAPINNCPFAPADEERTPVALACTTPIPSEPNVVVPVEVRPPAVIVKPPAVIVSPPPLIVRATPDDGVAIVSAPFALEVKGAADPVNEPN